MAASKLDPQSVPLANFQFEIYADSTSAPRMS
jgi:hypothetical protein